MPANKNKTWIWFFATLVVLAAVAIAINWGFNLKQQLKPEDLAAAIDRWDKNGPANYDMTIKKDVTSAGSDTMNDVIEVKVRSKRTIDLKLNGRELEQWQFSKYNMPSVFDWIERDMQIDRKPDAPRSYCVAQFDPVDGHVIRYLRSVRATGQREALDITFRKVD